MDTPHRRDVRGGGAVSFSRETTHKAKKQHICGCCLRPIAAGESYIRWAGLTDSNFCSIAMHPDCRDVEIKLNYADGSSFNDWYSLHEFVSDEGLQVLDGAPAAVRERFEIAGAPNA